MSDCNNVEEYARYAIPGILGPTPKVKFNKRVSSGYDGTIILPVYGPIPIEESEPDLKIYITLDYGREVETVYSDTTGKNIIKQLDPAQQKSYILKLTTADVLLSRGTYIVKVVKDNALVLEKYLVVNNTPSRSDNLDYYWRNANAFAATTYDLGALEI